jgi:hypothetical protein
MRGIKNNKARSIAAAALVMLAISFLFSRGSQVAGEPPVPVIKPVPLSAITLPAPEDHPDVGWTFVPPGDAHPTVSSDDAIQLGEQYDPVLAATVQPILALAPSGGNVSQDTLLWILRFDSACVPRYGPIQLPVSGPSSVLYCGVEEDVLVNATSGDYIATYSDR